MRRIPHQPARAAARPPWSLTTPRSRGAAVTTTSFSTVADQRGIFCGKGHFFGESSLLRNEPQYPTKGYASREGITSGELCRGTRGSNFEPFRYGRAHYKKGHTHTRTRSRLQRTHRGACGCALSFACTLLLFARIVVASPVSQRVALPAVASPCFAASRCLAAMLGGGSPPHRILERLAAAAAVRLAACLRACSAAW